MHSINFPTKDCWRDKSKYVYIDAGLLALDAAIKKFHIKSISIPALGCGLGGLDWLTVSERIAGLIDHNGKVRVYIYRPHRKVRKVISVTTEGETIS